MEWTQTRLLEKIIEVADIRTFRFEKPKGYDFKAGQYAFLRVQGQAKPLTISSSPTWDYLDFTTIFSTSDFKKALDGLDIKDEIEISHARGSFTLDVRASDDVVFLAGGVGITPVRAMLQYLADTGSGLDSATLIYSNRTEARIAFRKELEELDRKLDFLKVVHAVTDGTWEGERGFIDAHMIMRHATEPARCTFYIVGPPEFNDAMQKIAKDSGIKEENIRIENFYGY